MITWTYNELPDINWDHPDFGEVNLRVEAKGR